ncbi:hypothetical protein KI387_038291, partial [Taxus chinensis]
PTISNKVDELEKRIHSLEKKQVEDVSLPPGPTSTPSSSKRKGETPPQPPIIISDGEEDQSISTRCLRAALSLSLRHQRK